MTVYKIITLVLLVIIIGSSGCDYEDECITRIKTNPWTGEITEAKHENCN